MGAMYRADRDDPEFRRRVAIKPVRVAASSPDTLQRFKQERQILARLSHPCIARLRVGGSTPEGVPYLVMEFIKGEPITTWCERHACHPSKAARAISRLKISGVRPRSLRVRTSQVGCVCNGLGDAEDQISDAPGGGRRDRSSRLISATWPLWRPAPTPASRSSRTEPSGGGEGMMRDNWVSATHPSIAVSAGSSRTGRWLARLLLWPPDTAIRSRCVSMAQSGPGVSTPVVYLGPAVPNSKYTNLLRSLGSGRGGRHFGSREARFCGTIHRSATGMEP